MIFGSNVAGNPTAVPPVPPTIKNWIQTTSTTPLVYAYAPTDRVGDLSQLGFQAQTNPINAQSLDFPFAGVTFYGTALSLSGASAVAGVNIGGRQGLLIGAQRRPLRAVPLEQAAFI